MLTIISISLFASHITDPPLIKGTLVRVVLFIMNFGAITCLTVRQSETEDKARRTHDERLAANEQLSNAEEELQFQIEELNAAGEDDGFGLFLTREILGITGITIRETGIYGEGARFEILVPFGRFKTIDDA